MYRKPVYGCMKVVKRPYPEENAYERHVSILSDGRTIFVTLKLKNMQDCYMLYHNVEKHPYS